MIKIKLSYKEVVFDSTKKVLCTYNMHTIEIDYVDQSHFKNKNSLRKKSDNIFGNLKKNNAQNDDVKRIYPCFIVYDSCPTNKKEIPSQYIVL